jgi:hypothetical protein
MTNLKHFLIISFTILISCTKSSKEVQLEMLTVQILDQFIINQAAVINESEEFNSPLFIEINLNSIGKDTLELQVYLIEFRLNDYREDFKAHSKYKGFDIVIYGELNPLFYKLDNVQKSNYVHKYASSKEYIYDPPYWKLYFDKNGTLIKTFPKELFDIIDIEK